MWKNIVETEMPQVTVWRMRIAYWIPKATNTHSGYVIVLLFLCKNEGWNFNSGNYLFTTDTK